MEALHHAAIEGDGTAGAVLRRGERLDDAAGLGHLARRRGEDAVRDLDLARMDQSLAVETEIAGLDALRLEATLSSKALKTPSSTSRP